MTIAPGRVWAEDLGRQFTIAATRSRSIRASLLGYEDHKPREFWALRHVDLDIAPGTTFGIIGRNGSGKSTLLKILARIFGPSEGACRVGGRLSSLLELGAGFHPEFSAVENIYLAGSVYGLSRKEIAKDIDEILGFAEIEDFANQPVKTFSSGMFARLGFAVAMHVRPDVLVLDEVLAVGDEAFVQKCLGRIGDYRRQGGTMIMVTHDPSTVERICDQATLLEDGRQVFLGTGIEAVAEYHRRLADQSPDVRSFGPKAFDDGDLTVTAQVVGPSGTPRTRFREHEEFAIQLELVSKRDIRNAQLAVGLREATGYGLGNRSLRPFNLDAGVPRTVSMRLEHPPLHAGLFTIDLRISSEDGDAVLASVDHITELSVFSVEVNAEGAIRFDADWSID